MEILEVVQEPEDHIRRLNRVLEILLKLDLEVLDDLIQEQKIEK